MRPHPEAGYYCTRNGENNIPHGVHFITGEMICGRCNELKYPPLMQARCSKDAVCTECQVCRVCDDDAKRNSVLASPTEEQIAKATPYSTDILQEMSAKLNDIENFTRIKNAAQG